MQLTSYPQNYLPKNQQKFDNPSTMVPTNKYDFTVFRIRLHSCFYKNPVHISLKGVFNIISWTWLLKVVICFAAENDTLYAVVEKKSTTGATSSSIQKEIEEEDDSKKEKQQGATAAEPTGTSATSRNVVRLIDWLVFHVVSTF